jgi:hypothetical protein
MNLMAIMRNMVAIIVGGTVAVVLFQVGAAIAFVALYGIPLGASPGPPGISYFSLNLGFAAAAAFAGGRITRRVASQRSLAPVMVVGVALAVLALWGFSRPASQWPGWYPAVLACVALLGTYAGGRARRE